MLAFAAAMIIAADPAPVATTAPVPVSATSPVPLRVVVYKFNYFESSDTSYGTYGATAPNSAMLGSGINGSITIDVIGVDAKSSLIVDVTETTDAMNARAPLNCRMIVHSDGGTAIVSGKFDDPMMKIVPYLAASYYGGHDLQQGAQWSQESDVDRFHIITTTTVSKVDGDLATIDSTMKETKTEMDGAYSGTSSVVYDAPLLVAISVDIRLTQMQTEMGSSYEARAHYHFDRVSDSKAPG